jgi:hypothetical protein
MHFPRRSETNRTEEMTTSVAIATREFIGHRYEFTEILRLSFGSIVRTLFITQRNVKHTSVRPP